MSRGVLFVHNNFPGQFRDLAQALVARGVPCAAVGQDHAGAIEGVRVARYTLSRGTTPNILPLATRAEADLIRGRSAFEAARALKHEGWNPAVIVGHPGWGEMTFLRELFPDAKQVVFSEFWYRGRGLDVGFDTEFFPHDQDSILRADAKNAVMALACAEADAIVCPTPFQAGALPRVFGEQARIIHEGIDIDLARPGAAAPFPLPDGRTLSPETPVVTYINNNMEPLRGLHIFARALPRLLREAPDAHVLIIGQATRRPYGGSASDGRTWRDVCFDGVDIDPARVHFLGRTPHGVMLDALRLGCAHVYYTYPFVLSWSLCEAMACGCYVIGSDTPPLHDAIEDGVNGRLLPFFDHDALAGALVEACRNRGGYDAQRRAARETAVARFDRMKGRDAWLALLREMGVAIP